MVRHDPGSPRARAVVGFGSGACEVTTRYRLTGPGNVGQKNRIQARSGRACRHAVMETVEIMVRGLGNAIAAKNH
ncbi:MAG: hypothetical protein ISR64_10040 [Deltaproteobacteria bacterium]|nr:hypothetical protein [Deltaproteobacteria bacterium]